MKTAIALIALIGLAACTPPDGVSRAEFNRAAAEAAAQQIAALNAQGIELVSLDPTQQALLGAACGFIPVIYPEYAGDIAAWCVPALESAKDSEAAK